MEIVKNSAKDCYPAVQKTTLVIMERLQQVLQMEVRFRAFLAIDGKDVILLTHSSVFKALLSFWCFMYCIFSERYEAYAKNVVT